MPFLWALTVFLCFCFSCLWYLPSSSSSGLPQTSHGCPECKVVWCWSLLLVGVSVLPPNNYVLRAPPPSFCCGLCCLSTYLLSYISVMVLKPRSCHRFFLSWAHLAFEFSSTFASQLILDPVQRVDVKVGQMRKEKQHILSIYIPTFPSPASIPYAFLWHITV